MGHLRRNFTRLALLGPVPSCLSELHTCVLSHSVVSDCVPPHGLYVAHQAPPSMEFCRQEYWSGLPFPSPGEKWSKESNKENRGEMTESMIPTQFAFITCSSWCESGFCPSLPGTVCSGANVPRPSKGSSPALLTSWMVMRSKSTVPGK